MLVEGRDRRQLQDNCHSNPSPLTVPSPLPYRTHQPILASYYHYEGGTEAPDPVVPGSFAHLFTYSRLWSSRAQPQDGMLQSMPAGLGAPRYKEIQEREYEGL